MHWFALQIRPRYEKTAASILRAKGFEEFLPLYRSRRRWSDRVKDLDLPLFPGYLFCRFDYGDRRVPIVTTPGVIGFVGVGGCPAPVDPAEIDAVRRIIESGLAAEPWPYIREGSTVRIDHGALAGIEGVVVEIKKRYRLVVSVTLLQRSIGVEIDREWVSSVSPLPSRPAPLPRRASAF